MGWIACLLALATTGPQETWEQARLGRIPEDVSPIGRSVWNTAQTHLLSRSPFVWSPSGRQVAWIGERDGRYLPYVGSEPVQTELPYAEEPCFAGERAVFIVGRPVGADRVEKWLWIDGQRLGPEDWIDSVSVAEGGERIAFWTHPGARVGNASPGSTSSTHRLAVATLEGGGSWSVSRGETYTDHWTHPPRFLDDGKTAVAVAGDRSGWVIVSQRGKRTKELGDTNASVLAVGAAGSTVVWLTQFEGARSRKLWRDGRQVDKRRDWFDLPTLGPGGKTLAYVAEDERGRFVLPAGEQDAPGRFTHITELRFDPQGERIAFIANRGGGLLDPDEDPSDWTEIRGGGWSIAVLDLDQESLVETPAEGPSRDLTWSPDGTRLAWAEGREEGWQVVCEGLRSQAFDDVSAPRFDAAGRTLGFGAREGRELWWRVLEVEPVGAATDER